MGTTISNTHMFASSVTDTADASVAADLGIAKIGQSDAFNDSYSDKHSQTFTKSSSLKISEIGNGDGVDHDQDEFILWLNPAIGVLQGQNLSNGACSPNNTIRWSIGLSGSLPTVIWYKIPVKWLKDSSVMSKEAPSVYAQLRALKFTDDDFKTILSLDPFANGSTTITDEVRFRLTRNSFPYEPMLLDKDCNGGVCECLAFGGGIRNDFDTEDERSSQYEYTTGFSWSGEINVSDIFKVVGIDTSMGEEQKNYLVN